MQVLSSPRIATLNNQKAVLKVGTDEFFITNVSTSTSSTGTTSTTSPSITVQPFFSGIALDVTPQIDENANIILHVHPSVSVVSEKPKVVNLGTLGTFTLPLASSNVNETDSIVRVQDGNIVAIGGLMKQEQTDGKSQVPVAGDVPVAGALVRAEVAHLPQARNRDPDQAHGDRRQPGLAAGPHRHAGTDAESGSAPALGAAVAVYHHHFGLREAPFGITPDTTFVFSGKAHQEALNTLLVALRGGEGFIKVTGEVGTGKTLLCRRLLATLDASFVAAYLHNPALAPTTLLQALGAELGLALEHRDDQYHLLKGLNLALLNHARQGKAVVLCLDEAQAIPTESLETLRLLSNLETEKRKLLRFVLFGQPELDAKLADPSIRQIRQRITFHHRLRGLERGELEAYLAHRLRVAGHFGEPVFRRDSVRLLYRATHGTPRLVNILAHKSMISAFGEGSQEVAARHVRAAVRDTEGVRLPLLAW